MNIDNSILQQCLEKKEAGFSALYQKSVPYVFSIVKRYIKNREEQKDTTQEIYAQVFLKLETYDPSKAPFLVWLRKVTINCCLMQLRKGKAHFNVISIDERYDLSDNQQPTTALKRADIEKYLNFMPTGYKTIFMLHVIDGYDHKEISQQLNISIQTSRSQLSRGKKWIKNQLSDTNKSKAYGIL